MARDVRAGAQALLNSSTSTAVALLSLTLAIGANTALFSLFNALLLRPLPVPQPSELVALHTSIADEQNEHEPFTLPMFESLGDLHSLFTDLWVYDSGGISNFEAASQHRTAALATVSGTYYRGMRLKPLLGRFIEPRDVALRSGVSHSVAVISFRVWRSWYHGDPAILGKTLRIGSHPFTVIGVEPENYHGLVIDGSSDVTIPIYAPG